MPSTTQFPASVSLSTLTPKTGFAITGSGPFQQSGHSVSSAGNINADGVADIIIGAPARVFAETVGTECTAI